MKENAIEDQTAENRMGTARSYSCCLRWHYPLFFLRWYSHSTNFDPWNRIFVAQISEEAESTAITYAPHLGHCSLGCRNRIAVGMDHVFSCIG